MNKQTELTHSKNIVYTLFSYRSTQGYLLIHIKWRAKQCFY